jgi:putative hydrolase of the HAD superfamily
VDSTSFGLVVESKTEKKGRQAGWNSTQRPIQFAVFAGKIELRTCPQKLELSGDGMRRKPYALWQMIRVVTFDAAGTLIRLIQPPGMTYAESARAFGCDLDPERLQAAFRVAWQSLAPPEEWAGPRPNDDRGWWKELVSRTLREAGYKIARFDTYFDNVYATFARPGVWELFPDIPDVLPELARLRIRLGVISNFDRRLYAVLDHLNVLRAFENVIISSEIGASKPAPRIFLEAARRFRVEPGEILHIGDDADLDGKGALAAGCKAFVVNHDPNRMRPLLSLLQ